MVQTSACFTGDPCVTLGLTAPLGLGFEHLSTLYFAFPSLPSTSLPDPATLASAPALKFLDLVLNPDGFVDEFLFIGPVTSLSFVPEPRGVVLLAAAVAALSALRRRAA